MGFLYLIVIILAALFLLCMFYYTIWSSNPVTHKDRSIKRFIKDMRLMLLKHEDPYAEKNVKE